MQAERDLLASTGVIGEPLPDDSITGNLPALIKDLKADAWADGAPRRS